LSDFKQHYKLFENSGENLYLWLILGVAAVVVVYCCLLLPLATCKLQLETLDFQLVLNAAPVMPRPLPFRMRSAATTDCRLPTPSLSVACL